jgi:hypothetical protein
VLGLSRLANRIGLTNRAVRRPISVVFNSLTGSTNVGALGAQRGTTETPSNGSSSIDGVPPPARHIKRLRLPPVAPPAAPLKPPPGRLIEPLTERGPEVPPSPTLGVGSRIELPGGYNLVRDRPHRPKVTFHREGAVAPFNTAEWRLVTAWAPHFTWNRRMEVQQAPDGSYKPGFAFHPDPLFIWQTCVGLYVTAAHISAFVKLRPGQVSLSHDSEGREVWRLSWIRPKNQNHVDVPIPKDVAGWLPEYLRKPRPRLGYTYNFMFSKLSDFIYQKTIRVENGERIDGIRIHINCLRFRHSGIVRFKYFYRETDDVVAKWAGCSTETLRHYCNSEPAETTSRLNDQGLLDKFVP